ncbi:FGGY family carbohydrate kinase [Zeaxanthinibacter sp. PT1]|uniref:xylulokinase n=1 Tax=Zeaxanthinibacter TaxID=561554 RepID=UPI00234BDC4B|nr:FGGY family carbohydrate kinase [Zeaxanthinibacter sp. PT1]MDC6351168.1 FGGY family carbohydrate kinase [Zeaxanthinibacter sp. PT1]
MNYYIGYDIGSSSIKAALVHAETGEKINLVQVPSVEMLIRIPEKGWAEQDPEQWYQYVCNATKILLKESTLRPEQIIGIGIAYQMHGLVLVDRAGAVLRPAIIWCDSRAVDIGDNALKTLGESYCQTHLLNSPGNFTLSRLRWVKEHEPGLYDQLYKWMLPGDYVAFRLSGEITTTVPGLSEAVAWDFKENEPAERLLEEYELSTVHIPDILPTFSLQGTVSANASLNTGLAAGTPILYRAGDQPNNALSLDVLEPGEIACTGGTSGVLYGVTDKCEALLNSGINSFAHVNHTAIKNRIGKLLCINGTGIQYRWLKNILNASSYKQMDEWAGQVPAGSEGLIVLPFGNGAERMLQNRNPGTSLSNIDLNRHDQRHLCRATLEGIAFAFAYGMKLLQAEGADANLLRTGNDNLFRSTIFSTTLASLLQKEIHLYDTTGAVGAARACVVHQKDWDVFKKDKFAPTHIHTYEPVKPQQEILNKAYSQWALMLDANLN